MSKVWFSPIKNNSSMETISEKVLKLHQAAGFQKLFTPDEFTAVKIHFGEKNNTGHIKPEWIKPFISMIKESGCKPFLTDTNTLYKGERQNSIDHIIQAYKHGFSIDNLGIPVIIADGLLSKNFSEVPINGAHFKTVKIANDILHSDSLVVMSHITGHILSGLGGAVKNLAMGSAPRSGKQVQHADVKPQVKGEKCKSCGICISWCPKDAIRIYDGVAVIDEKKCYGCAECVATCRHGAIKYSFEGGSKVLQEKMAEYALGAVAGKENKVCCFNFLIHITKECDCINKAQDKVCEDIGILASYDPVAIDQASIDLVKQKTGTDLLGKLWPENNYNIQLEHAEKMGLGSRKYELVGVN
ncbi:MAG: DUF362 domain-containing protein [Bacillota bacterium]